MTAPSFTYSGNVYTGAAAGTVDFALTSTTGNAIAYLEPSHIHVYKSSNQGSTWTELTRPSQWDFVTNGTVARLVTGIAAGDWVKVQRITPSTSSYVTFQASSLLTADQLNDDTLFNTYLNQERVDQSDQSTLTANTASTNAATAVSTANTALSTANAASASAASAVSTANTASTNATAAVATANTASTNASAAVATANTASSNASAAVSTANTAASNAGTAVSTANAALTNANAAVTTSNNANTTAQAANTTATNAESIANSALSIVAGTVQFVPVANVAAIPASPSNDDAIQIQDSTGIQSFTPLTGLPSGFVGTPQLFVRLQYDTPGSTWQYVGYGANDPDNRYVIQGVTGTANNPSFYFDPDTGIYSPGANELGLSTGGAARLTIDSAGAVAIPGSLSVAGQAAVVTNDARLSDTRTPTDNTVSTAKIVDGAVTSAKIADGTIVNTDVSASAAIAGSKISPDFGSQNVTTTSTVTAASFIPTGSTVPTNGVYLPAANSVAISTNGTGRLFVDANGNVGINTASTIAPGGFGYAREFALTGATSGDSSVAINIRGSRTISGGFGDINFWHQSTSNRAFIQARRGSSDSAIDLDFITSGGAGMRITSAGLVGIGTSSPSTRLHLNSADASANYLRVENTGGYALFGVDGSGNTYAGAESNDAFGLVTNGSYRMYITAGGNVGIGTTSPSERLDVSGVIRSTNTSSAGYYFRGYRSSSTSAFYIYDDGTDIQLTNEQSGALQFRTANAERARIDSSGRLLVGTSSARSNFFNTTASAVLQIEGTATARRASIISCEAASDTGGSLVLAHQRSGSVGGNTIVNNGDLVGRLSYQGNDGAEFVEAASINCEIDGTPGANDMPGRLVFSTTADGASSPTERMRIQSNGRVLIGGTVDVGAYDLQVKATGVWGAGAYVNGSDRSLKEEIAPLASSLDLVKQLNPVSFRYKKEFSKDNSTQPGFIAQELRETLADQVYLDGIVQEGPEFLSVAYQGLIPVLAKALQEAVAKIETLEAKVASLESA